MTTLTSSPKRLTIEPNMRFGCWTVIAESSRAKNGAILWTCQCDCGDVGEVQAANLRSGGSESCGCLHKQRAREAATKHGHGGTWKDNKKSRTYNSWRGMKERCTNPNHISYPHYGGRDIKVCEGFQDFATFLLIMQERPQDRSIDRVKNDGHYSCGHCQECISHGWQFNLRWATGTQQELNKRQKV